MSNPPLPVLLVSLLAVSAGAAEPKRKAAEATCVPSTSAALSLSMTQLPLTKAAQKIADVTCKSIVLEPGVEQLPITLITPATVRHSAADVYTLFMETLSAHGLEAKPIDASGVLIQRRR